MPDLASATTRWLGVGLASALAVLTLGLAVTGRLSLYINPDSAWFAVGMAVIVILGAIASFALPLGAEADHGHEHGHDHDQADDHDHDHDPAAGQAAHMRHPLSVIATATGGTLATAIVLVALIVPPASLSTELAASRGAATPTLFAGSEVVTLASTGDTAEFGVGEWSTVFATATNPADFDGDPVALTGFASPGGEGFLLSRFVVTHCVIDAQPAGVPVAWDGSAPEPGEWVSVTGTVRSGSDGRLRIVADSVQSVPEPADPYEY